MSSGRRNCNFQTGRWRKPILNPTIDIKIDVLSRDIWFVFTALLRPCLTSCFLSVGVLIDAMNRKCRRANEKFNDFVTQLSEIPLYIFLLRWFSLTLESKLRWTAFYQYHFSGLHVIYILTFLKYNNLYHTHTVSPS